MMLIKDEPTNRHAYLFTMYKYALPEIIGMLNLIKENLHYDVLESDSLETFHEKNRVKFAVNLFDFIISHFSAEFLHDLIKKDFGIKSTKDIEQKKYNELLDHINSLFIDFGVSMENFHERKFAEDDIIKKNIHERIFDLWHAACRHQSITGDNAKNNLLGVHVAGYNIWKGYKNYRQFSRMDKEELMEFNDYLVGQAMELNFITEMDKPPYQLIYKMDNLILWNHKYKVCPITALRENLSEHHLTPIQNPDARANDADTITVFIHDSMHVAGFRNDSAHAGVNEFMKKFRFDECTITKGMIKELLL